MDAPKEINTKLSKGLLINNRYKIDWFRGNDYYFEKWEVMEKIDTESESYKGGMIIQLYHSIDIKDGYYDTNCSVEELNMMFEKDMKWCLYVFHPYILRPYDYGVYKNDFYVILPYFANDTVDRMIGEMTEVQIWKFIHDISAALACCHGHDMTGIDVTLENINFNQKGRTFFLNNILLRERLLSRVFRDLVYQPEQEQKAYNYLSYFAPERIRIGRNAVKASDIWSLAISIYRLMEGHHPFGDDSEDASDSNSLIFLMKRIRNAEYFPIKGDWSQELKRLIFLCFQIEPWNRPTAIQIFEWTEQYLSGSTPDLFVSYILPPKITSITSSPVFLKKGDTLELSASFWSDKWDTVIWGWEKDGERIGSSSWTFEKENVEFSDEGSYRFTIRSRRGAVVSDPIIVYIS